MNNSSINAIGGSGAGEGNLIANNNGAGIAMTGGTGNGVLGNRFYANASLGINLGTDPVTPNDAGDTDVGANNLQNFPVISSATLSGGTLHLVGTLDTNAALVNPGFRIEAFLSSACDPSGNGEGEFFVGASTISVDGSGHAAFTLDLPTSATGTVATATATAAGTGDTSEFSACASVSRRRWRRRRPSLRREHDERRQRRDVRRDPLQPAGGHSRGERACERRRA